MLVLSNREIGANWIAPTLTLAAAVLSVIIAPGARGLLGAVLAVLMGAIAIADLRHFIIPNVITGPAFLIGLLDSALRDSPAILEPVAIAALRCVTLALMFLLLREVYSRWRGREGIGLGDVKLAAVAGAWLDWLTLPLAIELAALAALAFYFLARIAGKRMVLSTSRVPFGLFFAPAIWAGWLFEVLSPAMS
jgi:leader peptidase (prepilin peptidase)/N-methyltransferase